MSMEIDLIEGLKKEINISIGVLSKCVVPSERELLAKRIVVQLNECEDRLQAIIDELSYDNSPENGQDKLLV